MWLVNALHSSVWLLDKRVLFEASNYFVTDMFSIASLLANDRRNSSKTDENKLSEFKNSNSYPECAPSPSRIKSHYSPESIEEISKCTACDHSSDDSSFRSEISGGFWRNCFDSGRRWFFFLFRSHSISDFKLLHRLNFHSYLNSNRWLMSTNYVFKTHWIQS